MSKKRSAILKSRKQLTHLCVDLGERANPEFVRVCVLRGERQQRDGEEAKQRHSSDGGRGSRQQASAGGEVERCTHASSALAALSLYPSAFLALAASAASPLRSLSPCAYSQNLPRGQPHHGGAPTGAEERRRGEEGKKREGRRRERGARTRSGGERGERGEQESEERR